MGLRSKIARFLTKGSPQSAVISPMLNLFGWNPEEDPEKILKKLKSWSYACTSRNVTACSQVPLRLYTVKGISRVKHKSVPVEDSKKTTYLQSKLANSLSGKIDIEEIIDHPALDLLRKVNPSQNSYDLKSQTFSYLESLGYAFWLKERGAGEKVINIWPLMAQNVNVIISKKNSLIEGFEYGKGKNKITYPVEDIVFFRNVSLVDPILGSSPMKSCMQAIDLHDYANRYEIASFKNGGSRRVVMTVPADGFIGNEDRLRIETEFKKKMAGVENAGKFVTLTGGAELKEIGLTPKEMAFLKGRQNVLEEICGAYGVPMSFVKIQDVSRANAWASMSLWAEYTLNPRLVQFEEKLNEQFTPEWGDNLYLLFDDARPKDREHRLKEIDNHITNKYSSVNEERSIDGLEPVEWGDKPHEPAPPMQPIQPDEPKKEVKTLGPKNELPKPDFVPVVFRTQLTILFKEIQAEVISNLKKKKSVKDVEGDVISAVFNKAKWEAKLEADMLPFIKGTVTQAMVEAIEKVNPEAAFNASSPAVLQAVDDRKGQIKTIISSTEKDMRGMLKEGIDLGESRSQLAKRIGTNFDAKSKADRVVRTENIWAHNEGTVEGWKQSGVVQAKQWDTAPDERRCEFCGDMHGKIVGIDDNYFGKGDEMQGRDGGTLSMEYETVNHPPLHPNCLTRNCFVLSADGITSVSKRLYNGNVIVFKTATGREFTCTPNHPILTNSGFVQADMLDIGSEVVAHGLRNGETFTDWQDINRPSTAEDIASTFLENSKMFTKEMPVSAKDFHGDGVGSEVAIIGADSLLMDSFYASLREHLFYNNLTIGKVRRILFDRLSVFALSFKTNRYSFCGLMSGFNLVHSLIWRHLAPFEGLCLALSSDMNIIANQAKSDASPTGAEMFSDSVFRPSTDVKINNFADDFTADFITHKNLQKYNDYVYNFQTPTSYYIAGGIASHNCRCSIIPVLIDD